MFPSLDHLEAMAKTASRIDLPAETVLGLIARARRVALDEGQLARALHGSGAAGLPDDWGTCINWEPGYGAACGPDKHAGEARRVASRYAAIGGLEK